MRTYHVVALWLVLLIEVLYYPAIATTLYNLAGGSGGPDSSMGYFRDRYVLPGAIGLAAVFAFALFTIRPSTAKGFRRLWIFAWLMNFAMLIASSAWYFHVTQAAAAFRR